MALFSSKWACEKKDVHNTLVYYFATLVTFHLQRTRLKRSIVIKYLLLNIYLFIAINKRMSIQH